MDAKDFHFHRDGSTDFLEFCAAQLMDSADPRLHLDGTLLHAAWLHQLARQRSELCCLKLLPFIVIFALGLDLGHGLFSGERREYFDLPPHFGRGQIHNAFRMAPEIDVKDCRAIACSLPAVYPQIYHHL